MDDRFDSETKHGIPTGSIKAKDLKVGDIFPKHGVWYEVTGEPETETKTVEDQSFKRTSGEHHKTRYRDSTLVHIPVDVIDVDEERSVGVSDSKTVLLGPKAPVQIYEKPTP